MLSENLITGEGKTPKKIRVGRLRVVRIERFTTRTHVKIISKLEREQKRGNRIAKTLTALLSEMG